MNKINAQRDRRGGVVLVITLLGVILLGGLVIWVLNTGDQINRRVAAQHAADASARAAAGWTARSLNTLAANNTAMARYLALVNLLEAMPLATRYTLDEAAALSTRLDEQLAHGFGGGLGGSADAALLRVVTEAYEDLLDEMLGDIDQLAPVASALDGFETDTLTHWDSGGQLWQALEAMDAVNDATVEALSGVVQDAGVSGAMANLPDGEPGAAAVILPFHPGVDARRGAFDDFLRPVVYGRLPLGIDDPVIRRGPYDALFGWRDDVYLTVPSTNPNPTTNPRPGASPGNPLSRRDVTGGGSHEHELVGYRTYGPQTRLMRDLRGQINDLMRTTRYDKYMSVLADAVRAHVWPILPGDMNLPPEYHTHLPGDDRQLRSPVGRFLDPTEPDDPNLPPPPPTFNTEPIVPDWRTDYDEAKDIGAAGEPIIHETAWFVVEIKSRYAVDDPRFMTDGSWSPVQHDNGFGYDNPRVSILGGWQSPDGRGGGWGGARWVTDHVWRSNWTDWAISDADIGLAPTYETVRQPDGSNADQLAWQEVYRIDTFVFGGVNVGEPTDVPNPYEGFDPLAEDAPAPMNLVTTFGETNAGVDEPTLRLLAITRQSDAPQAWSERFRGGRPDPSVVAIAQAKVFNNHSLDLWTQQWRAELEPVSDYDAWLERMSNDAPPTTPTTADAAQIEQLRQYLVNARDLAPLLLEH